MPDTLGERLAQARREMSVREHRDVSRLELAKAAEVDSSMISQYESNAKVPREDTLGRLAAFLGVTRAYLRYGILPERPVEPPLTTKEITDFVNEELAASRVYDAERAAGRATPPATPPAPAAAKKAAGGTKGRSRER